MIHRSGWGTVAMSRISCGLFRGGMALLVGTVLSEIGPTPLTAQRPAPADPITARIMQDLKQISGKDVIEG